MTDSKKPPSREEFQRLREAVAAQSEIIEEYLPDDPQKRKFLGEAAKGLGAVGALGIAGQSGYAVGQASAEASTSDSDTDIGSTNNRHDVFAEGLDANSVSTGSIQDRSSGHTYDVDELAIAKDLSDGLVVAVHSDGIDKFDPANTTTPVGDAIAACANSTAAQGGVHLPYGQTVQDAGPLQMQTEVSIYSNNSDIEITGDGNDGLVFAADDQIVAAGSYVSGVGIYGNLRVSHTNGVTGNTGYAVRHGNGSGSNGANGCYIENLYIADWGDIPWYEDSDALSFQNVYERVGFNQVDTGDLTRPYDTRAAGLITIDHSGKGDQWGYISAYPVDTRSAADSRIISSRASRSYQRLNIGGTPELILFSDGGATHVAEYWNYEPSSQNSTPGRLFFELNGGWNFVVSSGVIQGATVDYIYRCSNGRGFYEEPRVSGGSTVNNNKMYVNDTNGRATVYGGLSADVDVNSNGIPTPGIACLGDLTTKTT